MTTGSSPTDVARPPYALAGVVTLGVLALYIVTVAPTTQFWDTSEYIAAAKVLGIPHPPGSPLFVLIANVWGQIPLVASYALRINLFAALTSALASGLLFLAAERFLRPLVPAPRWARLAAAGSGIIVGATSFTVWNQSVVNAKVYTLSLLSIALVLWLALVWADLPKGHSRDKVLLLIGYLLVLTSTNHMMGVLAAPAVIALVMLNDWREALRPWVVALGVFATIAITGKWTAVVSGPDTWRIAVLLAAVAVVAYTALRDPKEFTRPILYLAIGAVIVGISLNFVFLPMRAAALPPINEGEPTTWPSLLAVLARDQYQKPPLSQRQADLYWQLANYIQYFTWQFAHDFSDKLRQTLAGLFGALGLWGAWCQWQRDRHRAIAMTLLMFTVTLLLVYYLNFKFGYSIRDGEPLIREVRERDYFFIVSFQLWGVWVALGLGAVLAAIAERLRHEQAWYVASPILLMCLIPLWGNRLTASRADETLPRDFAHDLLESVEPYGILISAGDNDTFPLWYAQEVEGIRPDVLVATVSLMNTEWHIRQLRRRPIVTFDSASAIAAYRGRSWPKPSDPPLTLTDEEIEALPPFFAVPEPRPFRVGKVRTTLSPGYLQRAEFVTLRFIRNNLGKRPIYFSRTSGQYGEDLGFEPYLLGQGMVKKLMPDSVRAGPGIVRHPTLGWIDLERTKSLLFEVYHPESAARSRPRGWVDAPSEGIVSLYAFLYAGVSEILSDSASVSADSTTIELADRAADLAERIFRQTSFFR